MEECHTPPLPAHTPLAHLLHLHFFCLTTTTCHPCTHSAHCLTRTHLPPLLPAHTLHTHTTLPAHLCLLFFLLLPALLTFTLLPMAAAASAKPAWHRHQTAAAAWRRRIGRWRSWAWRWQRRAARNRATEMIIVKPENEMTAKRNREAENRRSNAKTWRRHLQQNDSGGSEKKMVASGGENRRQWQ